MGALKPMTGGRQTLGWPRYSMYMRLGTVPLGNSFSTKVVEILYLRVSPVHVHACSPQGVRKTRISQHVYCCCCGAAGEKNAAGFRVVFRCCDISLVIEEQTST